MCKVDTSCKPSLLQIAYSIVTVNVSAIFLIMFATFTLFLLSYFLNKFLCASSALYSPLHLLNSSYKPPRDIPIIFAILVFVMFCFKSFSKICLSSYSNLFAIFSTPSFLKFVHFSPLYFVLT